MVNRGSNSLLFFYERRRKELKKISDTRFPRLRDVAYNRTGTRWVVVGNRGTILDVEEDGKISRAVTSTNQNLRGVDVNQKSGEILAVGNEGSVVAIDISGKQIMNKQEMPTRILKNFRRVKWSPKRTFALAVGNEGAAARLELEIDRILINEIVSDHTNHFRGLVWEGKGSRALIIGNNFGSGFVPASSVLVYNDGTKSFASLKEADGTEMVCLAAKPNSSYVTLAGYQIVFFGGSFFEFDWQKRKVTKSVSTDEREFVPTGIDWNPDRSNALVSTGRLNRGVNALYEYDGSAIKQIKTLDYVPVKVCWDNTGEKALVVVSTRLSIFSE